MDKGSERHENSWKCKHEAGSVIPQLVNKWNRNSRSTECFPKKLVLFNQLFGISSPSSIITWRKQGHINTPGITGLPSGCQQDEVLPLSPFSDRGCSYAVDGVLLICLVDHLTLPAVETQWCGCLELWDYWALCHIKQSAYVTEFILNIQWI